MPERAKAAYEEWKLADALARTAEKELRAAWDAFDSRVGPAPEEGLLARVGQLRAEANEKLALAVRLLSRGGSDRMPE